MDDDFEFEAPPQMVYAILIEKSKSDPMLARTLEAAQWQAAAMVLAKQQEAFPVGEVPDVTDS